ncbi:hypothetical protein DCC62_15745 [candidate division KSB1 bacterium]|nr:MAG: hypothetical protein DCC62_15745 [candidate division KSB1 bacterium]
MLLTLQLANHFQDDFAQQRRISVWPQLVEGFAHNAAQHVFRNFHIEINATIRLAARARLVWCDQKRCKFLIFFERARRGKAE